MFLHGKIPVQLTWIQQLHLGIREHMHTGATFYSMYWRANFPNGNQIYIKIYLILFFLKQCTTTIFSRIDYFLKCMRITIYKKMLHMDGLKFFSFHIFKPLPHPSFFQTIKGKWSAFYHIAINFRLNENIPSIKSLHLILQNKVKFPKWCHILSHLVFITLH